VYQWRPPPASALNLRRTDEKFCNILGAFVAEIYTSGVTSRGQPYPELVLANETRAAYLAAILPSDIPRPDNYTLSLWWDALHNEYNRSMDTALDYGSIYEWLLEPFRSQCSSSICKHLEWTGDQDVSGIGVCNISSYSRGYPGL
jgi:hypothetical protein